MTSQKQPGCTQAGNNNPPNFPQLWQWMFPQAFQSLRLPQEREATCDRCPKARYETYRADYRCCTYWPRIPNFLLGLATETPLGLAAIQDVIAKGMALPEGMVASPGQWKDYTEDLSAERFGASTKVLCPMLDQKTFLCRIHKWRNSVCSTYYCFKDHGKPGDKFWSAVSDLGSQMEAAIGQWAMRQMDFSAEGYIRRVDSLSDQIESLTDPVTGGWTQTARQKLWGDWFGREVEFYQACGEWARKYQDVLWEVAQGEDILESRRFENALIRWLPQSDEAEDEAMDSDEGEPWTPQELWDVVLKSYHKLWHIPESPLVLHQRVKIEKNPLVSQRDQDHRHKPYLLIKAGTKRRSDYECFLYLDEDEYAVLQGFQVPTCIDWQVLSSPQARRLQNSRGFLAESIGQGILVPVK